MSTGIRRRGVAFATLLAALPVSADPSRAELSNYEQETIDDALLTEKATIDPNPEGKIIERVDVVMLEVIEDRDPAPGFLNSLHATTRSAVVARELEFEAGTRFTWATVEESERILRSRRQLSLVLIVPVRSKKKGNVRVLVIAKDVWSLRLNWDVRFKEGKLEYLVLQPSEENVAGSHHAIASQFVLKPDTLSFGGKFSDRNLGGHDVGVAVDANVIVNRETGSAEGSFGGVEYGRFLQAATDEWAWGTNAVWLDEVTRRFEGLTPATYDADATPGDDALPYEHDTSALLWQTFVTRSFGRVDKSDLSVGLEANRKQFSTRAPPSADPAAVREFRERAIPTSDTRLGPFAELHAYSTRFQRSLDVNSLGLQEDYALGHELLLKAYTGFEGAASTRDVLGSYAGLAYTIPVGSGFARAYAASRIEIAPTVDESDGQAEAGGHLVTPKLGFGRVVYDAGVLHRYRDYLNRRFSIGGEGRLRGYTSGAFVGGDMVAQNLELRSVPLQIFTIQFGAVAFWDAGHAATSLDQIDLRHSVGGGLRAVFPQFARIVGRLDFAVPLSRYAPGEATPLSVILTFKQAFGPPQLSSFTPNLAGGT